MATQYFKLRDLFTLASARATALFHSSSKFSTYRFMKHTKISVSGGYSRYSIDGSEYGWTEARKIDRDAYSLWDVMQTRHNTGGVTGKCATRESQISANSRSIFTKAEALSALREKEVSWQAQGYSPANFQPTRGLHFSRRLPRGQTKLLLPPPPENLI